MKSVHAVIKTAETKPLTTEEIVAEATMERVWGNANENLLWVSKFSFFF